MSRACVGNTIIPPCPASEHAKSLKRGHQQGGPADPHGPMGGRALAHVEAWPMAWFLSSILLHGWPAALAQRGDSLSRNCLLGASPAAGSPAPSERDPTRRVFHLSPSVASIRSDAVTPCRGLELTHEKVRRTGFWERHGLLCDRNQEPGIIEEVAQVGCGTTR